jgi:polysaccharide biosynthesis transport protein
MSPQFSYLSIIRALWKHKVFISAAALLGSGATMAVVSELPPIYTANAMILVESQKIPENFVAATVQTALEAQLDTLKHEVLSSDRLWGLVEQFDLYKRQRRKLTKEEVLDLMRRDVNINLSRGWSARGPGAFQVEYQTGSPETAAAVANQIGMFFINENLRQRTDEAAETSKFLDDQLAAAEIRLKDQETKLKEFKLRHNGELPEQEAALLAVVNQSRGELLGIQEALGRAQQNKLILESSLAYAEANLRERRESAQRRAEASAAAAHVIVTPVQPEQPTALERAQAELSRLESRYYGSHPEVERMRAEVRRLEREEATSASGNRATQNAPATTQAANDASGGRPRANGPDEEFQAETDRIQGLTAQIAAVTREIRSLEERRQRVLQEMAESQEQIRNLPVREQQMAVITRDYDTSKANYQSLLNKKLAADVAADMERWHKSQRFTMLDPARVPQKPTRPRRTMLTAAGGLLSLALGASLAFLLELKRNTLLGEWELPADVLVIGRIPQMQF